jgi:lipocalin-like protein
MTVDLHGTWRLREWRRVAPDGDVTHPLGADPEGLLVYGPDGRMIVQMMAADRPVLDSPDPLQGDQGVRAQLYSTCLAYFGTYEVRDDSVVHNVEASLYPGWSGAEQVRPFEITGDELVLRTPPMTGANAGTVNEIVWVRDR